MSLQNSNIQVEEIDQAQFKSEVLNSKGVVLVAFVTTWSEPCQVLGPVLQDIGTSLFQLAIRILKINVDEELELAVWYEIQSIPTLVCFVDGQACARIVGSSTKEEILERLKPHLPDPNNAFTKTG